MLQKQYHLQVIIQHLDSGDIVFGDVGIERKTVSDLINSVIFRDRNLWTQLQTLKDTYKTPLLIIEGYIDFKCRILMGIITTLILFTKQQIIFTLNIKDTVNWVERLFVKYGVGKSNRVPPAAVIKANTPRDAKLAMIQCIRHIGVKHAEEILDKNPDIFSRKDYKLQLDNIKGLRKESKELLEKVIE